MTWTPVPIGMSKAILIRVLSGVFGVIAAGIALYAPFSFIAVTMTEIESAGQYHGHISILGAIGGPLLVLGVTGLFGIGAYKLLRRAARSHNT